MPTVAQPVQAQAFSLSGAGSSIGDTVLNLKSFKDILGVNLTMTQFGSIGYGTIEPGNNSQEEQISFSGVTQNSDGTAQLTGVKHVLFITPFTESSGMTITHAGSVTFVISNTAGFENAIYTYINSSGASGGVPATQANIGITRLSLDPVSIGSPIAVGTNDTRMLASGTIATYLNNIVNTGIPYATASGTAGAYTVTLASSISTLASGTFLNFLVPATNAPGVTLNINSLGPKTIKKNATATLASGDVKIGQEVSVIYDGTNFQLSSPLASAPSFPTMGSSSHDVSTTGAQTIPHGLGAIPRLVEITSIIDMEANSVNGSPGRGTSMCYGFFDGINTNSNGSYFVMATIGSTNGGFSSTQQSSTYAIYLTTAFNTTHEALATIAVDATNITLTWSKTSSPTGTAIFNWKAQA